SLAALYLALHSAMVRPLAASSSAPALAVFLAGLSLAAVLVFLEALLSAAPASVPHSALRNWFQVWPSSVPASLAELYLALHSAMVSAPAGAARSNDMTASPVSVANRLISMSFLQCAAVVVPCQAIPPHASSRQCR